MSATLRWTLGLGITALVTAVPFAYFRYDYTHSKRLRTVDAGRLYRSGQMTVEGFADAVARYHLRTILNVQDEFPDPDIRLSFLNGSTMPESEMCRQLGVRYVFIAPDLLLPQQLKKHRPEAIDQFLEVMDDPANYPVLLHCHAGLHRTGVLVGVYRMEYQGWSPLAAVHEIKANGFGQFICTRTNEYIDQYVLHYRPGLRQRDTDDSSPEEGERPKAVSPLPGLLGPIQ